MNLAQRLAENILRFNAKNLDNSAISNIKQRIIEQSTGTVSIPKSVDELKDSQQVKSAPGYADVMGRLITLANKRKGASSEVKALQYWMGGVGSDKTVQGTDNIIAALNLINTKFTASDLSKEPFVTKPLAVNIQNFIKRLQELVTLLETNKQKNVYINVNKAMPQAMNNINYIVKQGDKLKISSAAAGGTDTYVTNLVNPTGTSLKDINNVITNFSVQRNGQDIIAKIAISVITDADKIQLLAAAQNQITEHKEKNKLSRGIKGVDSIVIAPAAEFDSVVRTVTPVPDANGKIPVIRTITYPDIKDGNNAAAQNFFGDNQSQVTPEQKKIFAEYLQGGIKSLQDAGVTLTEIRYNAGASTSRVHTGYKGIGVPLDTVTTEDNNKILVQDRLNSINATLKAVIQENPIAKSLKIVENPSDAKPNQGPTYAKGQWKFVNGKISPDQQAAYEKTYAPYRSSFGAFTLIGSTTPPPIPQNPTVDYTGTGKWKIKLTWDTIDLPPWTPPSGGTVSVYPTDGGGIKCPIF